MNTTPKTNKSWIIEYLPKIGNYLLGISLLCYITGFVITNLYLGSMGIVNLEIIRSRYILSGFLFFIFLGAIVYLVYGLIKTIRKYQEKSALNVILRVIWHSIGNISMLYFAIPVLAILAGAFKIPPNKLPQLSPIIPWTEWFNTVSVSILKQSIVYFGILIVGIILVMVIIIGINPKDKDGNKRTRKQILGEIFMEIWKKKLKFIGGLFAVFVVIYLWLFMSDALRLISTNVVNDIPRSSPSKFFTDLSAIGWSRFFYMIIIIYSLIALLLTTSFLSRSSQVTVEDDNPLGKIHGWIFIVVMAFILIVPTYTLGVYPNIPQQIGGGQILRVDAQISNIDVSKLFSDPNTNSYLIDRTSRSSIFLLIDNVTNEYKVQEIQNDLILSITYNP